MLMRGNAQLISQHKLASQLCQEQKRTAGTDASLFRARMRLRSIYARCCSVLRAADTFVLPWNASALLAASDFNHLTGIAAAIILHIHNLIVGQRAARRHFSQHFVLTVLLAASKKHGAGKRDGCCCVQQSAHDDSPVSFSVTDAGLRQ
ncbi:MAG TPA: hypothetical protein VLS45_00760 [Methylomicrobium sp.]|nr:hypothetical protein [Methylomicrobium sp.]